MLRIIIPISVSFLSSAVLAQELPTVQLRSEIPEYAGNKISELTVITLQGAINKSLSSSPRLKASEASLLASQGGRKQSAALPNPEVGFEVENIQGSGQLKGFESAESTLGVTQLIEVGGKRSARIGMADQDVTLARFDRDAVKLDLIRDVQLAYADAVAAQEEVKLAEDEKKLATEVLKSVKKRVDAAREPLIQQSKAEITFASSEIAYEQAQRDLTSAKRFLAALWGSKEDFELDNSAFFNITEPETISETNDYLKNNPDFARYDSEVMKSKAAFELEMANAVPDPSLSAGIRNFRDTGDEAFLVGVSMPIPVFNLNRGNIEKARHELSQTKNSKNASMLTLNANLIKAQADLATSYQQAISLRDKILPASEKAFSLSNQGYQAGKFAYLEVLDSQRTLFEAREQYHNTLKEYHRNKAEVERLLAIHLQNTNTKEN